MEIQQLRYFTVAARYQHITKAAEEIHIAQPALTQIIKRLESEVGAPLFERNGRNIILTPEGKILQEEALQILKTIDELPIVLQQKKTERDKTLKIKVSAATIWFMPAIIAYKKNAPRRKPRFYPQRRYEGLRLFDNHKHGYRRAGRRKFYR